MSDRPPDAQFERARRGAAARRVRYTLLTLALILLTTVLCGAAVFIGETRRLRADVTATREHSLSPRLTTLLAGLREPHELVVVVDGSKLDAGAAQRLADLLGAIDRGSPDLTTTLINTADPADRARFEELPRRMLALRSAEVRAARSAVDAAKADAEAVAQSLDALASALGEWPEVMRTAGADAEVLDALGELAALARVRRDEVTQVASAFPTAGIAVVAGVQLPDVNAARGSLGVVLSRAAESLETVALASRRVAAADLYAPLHDRARTIVPQAEAARDAALRASDALQRAPGVKLLGTLRLLQNTDAAVLLSPSEVVAIAIDSLISTDAGGAAQVRFEAERAITSALAAASAASGGGAPLLVLTHSQPTPILAPPGPGQQDAAGALRGLLDHLAAQGYEIAEWAASVDAQRPSFSEARAAKRPIVWIVLPGAASTSDGASRMGKLARAVEGLLRDGESLLVNVGPSLLPRVGEPDPLVAPFEPLGLSIDSGRPLTETVSTPAGPRSASLFRVLDANREHPVGGAVGGLAVALLWPSPMTITGGPEMDWATLLTIETRDNVWGESQWPTLVQAGAMGAAATFDERVDARGGPWTVAAAGERFVEGASTPQRVVVVGSNGWFFDAVALSSTVVDGRRNLANPGNLELVDASLLWLSGREDLIASGADTGGRIGPIEPGTLRLLWWLCILGPATATLLLGAALRMLRG